MKQHITEEQLKKLDLTLIHKLIRGDIQRHPFRCEEVTIGKMIEVLDNYKSINIEKSIGWWVGFDNGNFQVNSNGLCDSLFAALCYVLEGEV